MKFLAAFLLGLTLVTGAALAQTATPTADTVVSFAGIFNEYLMPAIVAAAATFAAWVIRKVDKLFGSRLSDENRAALEAAAHRGILWAADKISTQVNERKITDVDVKNAVVAGALNYVTFYMPDTLKFFGITRENLQARIEAQLAEMLGMSTIVEVTAAPAGPAAPPPVAAPTAANDNGPIGSGIIPSPA